MFITHVPCEYIIITYIIKIYICFREEKPIVHLKVTSPDRQETGLWNITLIGIGICINTDQVVVYSMNYTSDPCALQRGCQFNYYYQIDMIREACHFTCPPTSESNFEIDIIFQRYGNNKICEIVSDGIIS